MYKFIYQFTASFELPEPHTECRMATVDYLIHADTPAEAWVIATHRASNTILNGLAVSRITLVRTMPSMANS